MTYRIFNPASGYEGPIGQPYEFTERANAEAKADSLRETWPERTFEVVPVDEQGSILKEVARA